MHKDGVMDRSRQWPAGYGQVSSHHYDRYQEVVPVAYGRILDAACGAGYGAQMLSVGDREVVGVDMDPEAIRWASKWFPGPKYILGKIEDSPWEGRFDTVVSFETIEHVREPDALLKALRKACDGVFIASVPNEVLYPFKAETFANDDSPHYRHYTPEQFDELLIKHGFSVVRRFCQVGKLESEVVAGVNGKFLLYVCE